VVGIKTGWDRGLSWEECKRILDQALAKALNPSPSVADVNSLGYLAVLYTQLYNGCRVKEALVAVGGWLEDGQNVREVRVQKRKDNKYRTVIVPKIIPRDAINTLALKVSNIKVYANRLGLNTHTLRYAFITKCLKEGHNPAVVAKITGHKRLDQLLTYVQNREAEEILKNFVPGAGGSPSVDGDRVEVKK